MSAPWRRPVVKKVETLMRLTAFEENEIRTEEITVDEKMRVRVEEADVIDRPPRKCDGCEKETMQQIGLKDPEVSWGTFFHCSACDCLFRKEKVKKIVYRSEDGLEFVESSQTEMKLHGRYESLAIMYNKIFNGSEEPFGNNRYLQNSILPGTFVGYTGVFDFLCSNKTQFMFNACKFGQNIFISNSAKVYRPHDPDFYWGIEFRGAKEKFVNLVNVTLASDITLSIVSVVETRDPVDTAITVFKENKEDASLRNRLSSIGRRLRLGNMNRLKVVFNKEQENEFAEYYNFQDGKFTDETTGETFIMTHDEINTPLLSTLKKLEKIKETVEKDPTYFYEVQNGRDIRIKRTIKIDMDSLLPGFKELVSDLS